MSFAPEDWVVIPGHGLGQIVSREPATATLPARFRIALSAGRGTIEKPVGTPTIRWPSDRTTVLRALSTLTKQPGKLPSKLHLQQKEIQQRLQTPQLEELARLLCDLHLPQGKEKSHTRTEYFDKVLLVFASEVAHVLNEPMDIRGTIEGILATKEIPPELKTP